MFPEVNKILDYFLKNPTQSIHLRELARQTGFSPAGALKAAKKLVKSGLVSEKKGTVVTHYKANADNPLWRPLKRAYNYYSLFESGLVAALNKEYGEPVAIVLFGSYAKGEDIETSDVDIAVITTDGIESDTKKFEKILCRKINIIEVDLTSMKKEFRNNLINGAVLSGYLQW